MSDEEFLPLINSLPNRLTDGHFEIWLENSQPWLRLLQPYVTAELSHDVSAARQTNADRVVIDTLYRIFIHEFGIWNKEIALPLILDALAAVQHINLEFRMMVVNLLRT